MVAIKIVKIRTRYQATVWSGLNLRETFQWNIDTNTSWWQQKAMINGVSSYLSSVTLLLTGPIMTCDTWRATFQSWSKHQLSLSCNRRHQSRCCYQSIRWHQSSHTSDMRERSDHRSGPTGLRMMTTLTAVLWSLWCVLWWLLRDKYLEGVYSPP